MSEDTILVRRPFRHAHMDDREVFKKLYDDLHKSPVYDTSRWQYEWMRQFDPSPGSSILDLGCSSGRNVFYYAERGHLCHGVEVSEEALAQFREGWEGASEKAQHLSLAEQGFIEDYHPQPRWDYVLLTEVLEHVVDPVPVLKVAERALKPSGEVYVTAPVYTTAGDVQHVRGVQIGPLKHWCEQAGLEVKWYEEFTARIYAKLVKSV